MSDFDAAGGPWGYRLRPASGGGIDCYIEAGTWTDQPEPQLQGRIPDQTIYAGAMADGSTFVTRHNWFNQGAHYRACVANYPGFPRVTVVDYHNLQTLAPILPELILGVGGVVNLAPLVALLADPWVAADANRRFALLALLSGAAVSDAQRSALATALALDATATDILRRHGVLLVAHVGTFEAADYAVIDATLGLLPDPVKDAFHVLVLDEALSIAGGFRSGGIIYIQEHAGGASGFAPYPGGNQVPNVTSHLQTLLMHELGHMLDASSVGLEAPRYDTIYTAGATDPDAFLYGAVYPVPTEDIIFFVVGYTADSATVVAEVAARGNAVLSQKLAHVIDMYPSVVPGQVPFFTTDPITHVTTVALAPVTRAAGVALGDDGMITSVNGVAF